MKVEGGRRLAVFGRMDVMGQMHGQTGFVMMCVVVFDSCI